VGRGISCTFTCHTQEGSNGQVRCDLKKKTDSITGQRGAEDGIREEGKGCRKAWELGPDATVWMGERAGEILGLGERKGYLPGEVA